HNHLQDRACHMYVLMRVHMCDRDSSGANLFDLRANFRCHLASTYPAACDAPEKPATRVAEATIGTDKARYAGRLEHGAAVGQIQVDADAEPWGLARQGDR